jgi:hypothetical protein
MKRAILVAVLAAASTVALAIPASAWPPVCKEPIYTLTGKCI